MIDDFFDDFDCADAFFVGGFVGSIIEEEEKELRRLEREMDIESDLEEEIDECDIYDPTDEDPYP